MAAHSSSRFVEHELICNSTHLGTIMVHIRDRITGRDVSSLAAAIEFELNPRNKGKHGLLLERLLGIEPNSCPLPDINGEHELKCPKFYRQPTLKKWTPENGIKIASINPEDVATTPFADSHVYAKLRSLVILPVLVHRKHSEYEIFAEPLHYQLKPNSATYRQLRRDYDAIAEQIRSGRALTGRIGEYMQPRRSGSRNSSSRAFYLRPDFITEGMFDAATRDAHSSLWEAGTGLNLGH